jgi:hypothetical protein
MATCTARSSRFRGRVRRSIWIWARLSTWKIPTVSPAQTVVDDLVVEVDAGQVRRLAVPLGDQVDALLDQREHPQGQEIDLDEARVLARVLVPLAEHPALPGRRLQRDDLEEGAARDDHAAHVLRDVAGEPGDVLGELAEQLPEMSVGSVLELGQRGDLFGEPRRRTVLRQLRQLLELPHGEVERLADLAHRRLEPVRGKGADEPRVVVAVLLVDPEDELLADISREVEVDVRHAPERFVQEAAQEEVVLHRIDVREPDQVADDARDRRAPAPARREPRARPRRVARAPRARPRRRAP